MNLRLTIAYLRKIAIMKPIWQSQKCFFNPSENKIQT